MSMTTTELRASLRAPTEAVACGSRRALRRWVWPMCRCTCLRTRATYLQRLVRLRLWRKSRAATTRVSWERTVAPAQRIAMSVRPPVAMGNAMAKRAAPCAQRIATCVRPPVAMGNAMAKRAAPCAQRTAALVTIPVVVLSSVAISARPIKCATDRFWQRPTQQGAAQGNASCQNPSAGETGMAKTGTRQSRIKAVMVHALCLVAWCRLNLQSIFTSTVIST